MALPLIIAAGSAGALLWDTVDSFINGDQPQTVINVEPGATLNQGKTDTVATGGVSALLLLGGGLLLVRYLMTRGG